MACWHFTKSHYAELLRCCSVKTVVMKHSEMSNITLQEAKQITEEAYIYGLQQAVFYETRFTFTQPASHLQKEKNYD